MVLYGECVVGVVCGVWFGLWLLNQGALKTLHILYMKNQCALSIQMYQICVVCFFSVLFSIVWFFFTRSSVRNNLINFSLLAILFMAFQREPRSSKTITSKLAWTEFLFAPIWFLFRGKIWMYCIVSSWPEQNIHAPTNHNRFDNCDWFGVFFSL